MMVKEIDVIAEGSLVVDQEILDAAGLSGHLRLIIQKGEIRILPETTFDPEKVLEDLAGCLGKEPATEYEFCLKIDGIYETR